MFLVPGAQTDEDGKFQPCYPGIVVFSAWTKTECSVYCCLSNGRHQVHFRSHVNACLQSVILLPKIECNWTRLGPARQDATFCSYFTAVYHKTFWEGCWGYSWQKFQHLERLLFLNFVVARWWVSSLRKTKIIKLKGFIEKSFHWTDIIMWGDLPSISIVVSAYLLAIHIYFKVVLY